MYDSVKLYDSERIHRLDDAGTLVIVVLEAVISLETSVHM